MSLCKNAKLHATMFCVWSRNVSICFFNCYKFDITCRLELLLYLATKLKTRYFICDTTLRNTKQPTVHSTVTFRRDLSSGKGTESARWTTGGSVGSRNYGKKEFRPHWRINNHIARGTNTVWNEIFAGSNSCDFSGDPQK